MPDRRPTAHDSEHGHILRREVAHISPPRGETFLPARQYAPPENLHPSVTYRPTIPDKKARRNQRKPKGLPLATAIPAERHQFFDMPERVTALTSSLAFQRIAAGHPTQATQRPLRRFRTFPFPADTSRSVTG